MSSENIIINTIDMKKEKRREYMKEYDKDRYRPAYYEEKRAEKKYCICGCLVKREYMFLHTETPKHERMLKHQTPEMILNIEKMNGKIDKEYKEKYDEKKYQEKLKKEQEKKEDDEKLKQIRVKREQQQSRYLRISCPCGGEFQKREQNRHEKCKQHIEYVQIKKQTTLTL